MRAVHQSRREHKKVEMRFAHVKDFRVSRSPHLDGALVVGC